MIYLLFLEIIRIKNNFLEVAVIKNNRIMKCTLIMVVSLLLVLNFSIGVSSSSGYDRQEADACITISQRFTVKG